MIKTQESLSRSCKNSINDTIITATPTYKITATLLNSWLYYLSSNQPLEEFLKVLKKEPMEDEKGYLQRGLEFENEVLNKNITEINNVLKDMRCYQLKKHKDLNVKIDNDIINIRVVGVADFIYKNCVFDIKRVSIYNLGHYLTDTTQHYIYSMLFNVKHFKYLIYDNDNDLHIESYDEDIEISTNETIRVIENFLKFLKINKLYMLYVKNWRIK